MRRVFKIFFLTVATFVIFALAGTAQAANYYAHPQGSGTACTLASPCSLSTLNGKLQAGDTGYLRGGNYTQQINPANNGTGDSLRITYARYQGETANINYLGGNQAELQSKRYLLIDGLDFKNANGKWIYMPSSDHITVKNCSFFNSSAWQGVDMTNAHYGKIINNVFMPKEDIGQSSPSDHIWVFGNTSHNLFEGNTFYETDHYGLNIQENADRNIVRNNVFNNKWHANVGVYNLWNTGNRNLVENNIVKNAGDDCLNDPRCSGSCRHCQTGDERFFNTYDQAGAQIAYGTSNTIVRNNIFFNNGCYAMGSGGDRTSVNNKIYNNTFDQNEHALRAAQGEDYLEFSGNVFKNNSITRSSEYAMMVWISAEDYSRDVQVFLNNNWYQNPSYRYKGIFSSIENLQLRYPLEFQNNTSLDPKFTNWDARDYTLQATSPLIDAGAWLTTVVSASGNGLSFTVADSGYFCDGWGIVEGDTIQFQNQTTKAKITTIDYLANRITVDRTMSWTKGLGVSLAYSGAAPDIGAKELGDTAPPAAPSGLTVR